MTNTENTSANPSNSDPEVNLESMNEVIIKSAEPGSSKETAINKKN